MKSEFPDKVSPSRSICPITDLPVYIRKEWEDIKIGEDFRITFSVIGDRILVIKPFGRVTSEIIDHLIPVVDSIINEIFTRVDEFVIIEDFDGISNVSILGRKRYIEYYQTFKNLKAVVVCSSSPLMHLSIKLATRFSSGNFVVCIEKNLRDGFERALNLLKSAGISDKNKYVSEESLISFDVENSTIEKCPYTGLPVERRLEWTRVDLGGPQVTFWVIGGKILASALHNWVDVSGETFRRLFSLRRSVIEHAFGADGKFAEIRDYTGYNRGSSTKLRSEFISHIRPDKNRIVTFVGYNAPLSVRISFNVGQRLYSSPFPWETVRHYSDAVNMALISLKAKGVKIPLIQTRVTKDEWLLDLDGFSAHYEIINGDIIHRTVKGIVKLEHVDPVYELQCRVVKEAGLLDQPHYFINNVADLKGAGFKARKKYFGYVSSWVGKYSGHRLTIMYGVNRMIRASLALSNLLRPYSLRVCDTLEEAMVSVANDRVDASNRVKIPFYVQDHDDALVMKYSDELLQFLGSINWEMDDETKFGKTVSPSHPFKTVFDAITLIKSDIDELFSNHAKTKKDLEESKEIANVLTQEIIKAQENERQRIARDLHDNVAQDLASLIIANDGLFEGVDEVPHDLRRRVMKNSRTLKRAIESIRNLAYDLRPPSLDQLGLVKTLSQYCSDFQEINMLNVDFYSAGVDELDLDFDTEINIYRVIQEALNNIKKHANATYVSIHLITSFPHIILKIEDDGDGFDIAVRTEEAVIEKRMGLKSMEERARLLSGDFTIRSLVGKGTMVRLTIPYS